MVNFSWFDFKSKGWNYQCLRTSPRISHYLRKLSNSYSLEIVSFRNSTHAFKLLTSQRSMQNRWPATNQLSNFEWTWSGSSEQRPSKWMRFESAEPNIPNKNEQSGWSVPWYCSDNKNVYFLTNARCLESLFSKFRLRKSCIAVVPRVLCSCWSRRLKPNLRFPL